MFSATASGRWPWFTANGLAPSAFQDRLVGGRFFLLGSNVSSILQFLGNFWHSILGEDGFSSPTRYTSVFSHVELDLPIDWPLIIAVSEIQAHVVTQLMRILNFSVPYSGSPYYTQSSIIFSELNFHLE